MQELYPLKFKPIYKEKIWGDQRLRTELNKAIDPDKNMGESWEVSTVNDNISVVANGFLAGNNLEELIEVYMGDLVGESIFKKHGMQFPLLFKFIDADDVLSIQVHPDDEMAGRKHGDNGKTEMWYVISAEKGAQLISGFNQEMDRDTYLKHLKNDTLPDILNYEKVESGDVFYLPAGRIHAIGAGILLAEIQQTSDFTYRIYDWNRAGPDGKPRELHTDLALEALDFKYYGQYRTPYERKKNEASNLVTCDYFTTNLMELTKPRQRDLIELDSFIVYMCLDGRVELVYDEDSSVRIEKGETLMIPAAIEHLAYKPEPYAKLLEVYIQKKEES
jgi:mannose-6-phosphate isomerase